MFNRKREIKEMRDKHELKDERLLLELNGETVTLNEYTFNYLHEYAAANLFNMLGIKHKEAKQFQNVWMLLVASMHTVMFSKEVSNNFLEDIKEYLEEKKGEYDA